MLRSPIILLACVLASALLAQRMPQGHTFYPELLHEDLEALREVVHHTHPDPYRYVSRAELDRLFDAVRDSIRTPMSAQGFTAAIMPIFHSIGCAHTYASQTEAALSEELRSARLIPLKVRVIDGGLFVESEPKGFRSIPLGSRIHGINDLTARQVLDRMSDHLVTDGRDTHYRDHLVEQDFPLLYHRFVEPFAGSFKVRFEAPDGALGERIIMGMTMQEIADSQRALRMPLPLWRSNVYEDLGAMWVTLSTLDADTLAKAGFKPEQFLADLLKVLKRDQVKVLVLDIRGAGGRELAMAEMVFGMIAKEPYRVVRSMAVRSNNLPDRYDFTKPEAEFYASINGQYLPDGDGALVLRPDDPRLRFLEPTGKAFSEKVFVVTDGGTREAGAALAIMARRSGRARLVGKPTGTNALSFCGGREVVLTAPRTGVRFHIPLIRYTFDGMPSGPTDMGEMPHLDAAPVQWGLAKGRDTVRGALLEMLRELR